MSAPAGTPNLPYPGLRPFEEADHELFFGREEQVGGLLGLLEDASLVAVVGASGSGKSSLVKAGLLPVVRQGFLLGTDDWIVAVARPGEEPYGCLAHQLAAVLPAAKPELLQALRRSDRGLLGACELAKVGPETRVLVVVDQFEELFGFRRAATGAESPISRDQAAAFVAMLLRTGAEPKGRIRVILTMRSDFIGDCEAFLGLPEAISRSQFLVPRLTRSQMEEAIVRPGQVDRAGYEPFSFEEGLVNRIVNDAGDRPDQLPLMQHALMRTFKLAKARGSASLLGHQDYAAAGTIEKALSNDADAAWQELGGSRPQEIARRLFLLLCDVSADGQIVRRRPAMAEVMEVAGAKSEEVEPVVRAFQREDRNFLLPPAELPLVATSLLDVSHEALLRRWDRFQAWRLDETRDSTELRRLAEQAELRREGQGGLIAAADLRRIREWQKRASMPWSRRYVSEKTWGQVLELISSSRRVAQGMGCAVVMVALLLIAAVFFSVGQARKAKAAQVTSEQALVNGFYRTIGVDVNFEQAAQEQWEPLWDLAELDDVDVRLQLVRKWFASPEMLDHPGNGEGKGLRAVGELAPQIRRELSRRASELASQQVEQIEQGTYFSAEAIDRLEVAARLVERADAAKLADRLVAALEEPGVNATGSSDVSGAFAVLARRLESEDLRKLAARVAAALGAEKDGFKRATLESMAETLVERLPPEEAEQIEQNLAGPRDAARPADPAEVGKEDLEGAAEAQATALAARVRQLGSSRGPRPGLIDRLVAWQEIQAQSEALAALLARLDRPSSNRLAGPLAAGMAAAGAEEGEPLLASAWSSSLAALAGHAEKAKARQWALPAAERLSAAIAASEDMYPLSSLSESLAALCPLLENAQAAPLASAAAARLAAAMEATTADFELTPLHRALAALMPHLAEADSGRLAVRAAERLALVLDTVAGIEMADDISLVPLAEWIPAADAARLAETLLGALKNKSKGRSTALGASLAALLPRLAAADLDRAGRDLAAAIEAAKDDPPHFDSLCKVAEEAAPLLEKRSAAALADRLAVLSENGSVSQDDLALAFAALALRLLPDQRQPAMLAIANILRDAVPRDWLEETAAPEKRELVDALLKGLDKRELVEILKWPSCVGGVEKLVLARLEEKAGSVGGPPVAFGGDLGKLVDRADSLGIKNHGTPARRPRLEDVRKELAPLLR